MRTALRILLGLSFCAVGVLHFTHTSVFNGIMPPQFPVWSHAPIVWFTGVWEIAGGLAILFNRTMRWGAWALIALLIVVFPANIHMAVNNVGIAGIEPDPVALWLRLPFQAVLAAGVIWSTRFRTLVVS